MHPQNLSAKQSVFVEVDADEVVLEEEQAVEVGVGEPELGEETHTAVYDHNKVENDFTDHYDA